MDIKCPICGKHLTGAPDDYPPRPFCSMRCKQVDLSNWFGEAYRISRPVGPEDQPEPSNRDRN